MLGLAFLLLLIAGLAGSVLAALHLRGGPPPRAMYGVLHGVLGLAGFIVLLPALVGPPRGEAVGVVQFGGVAAVLLIMVLLAAVPIVIARMGRRRVPGVVIGAHASIAITALVILAAYTLVG